MRCRGFPLPQNTTSSAGPHRTSSRRRSKARRHLPEASGHVLAARPSTGAGGERRGPALEPGTGPGCMLLAYAEDHPPASSRLTASARTVALLADDHLHGCRSTWWATRSTGSTVPELAGRRPYANRQQEAPWSGSRLWWKHAVDVPTKSKALFHQGPRSADCRPPETDAARSPVRAHRHAVDDDVVVVVLRQQHAHRCRR